jgi:hypothetical protein
MTKVTFDAYVQGALTAVLIIIISAVIRLARRGRAEDVGGRKIMRFGLIVKGLAAALIAGASGTIGIYLWAAFRYTDFVKAHEATVGSVLVCILPLEAVAGAVLYNVFCTQVSFDNDGIYYARPFAGKIIIRWCEITSFNVGGSLQVRAAGLKRITVSSFRDGYDELVFLLRDRKF